MTEQMKIETCHLLLMIGRMPVELGSQFIGVEGEPAELLMNACLIFAGMGVVWPLPCLARRGDGKWFHVECGDLSQ